MGKHSSSSSCSDVHERDLKARKKAEKKKLKKDKKDKKDKKEKKEKKGQSFSLNVPGKQPAPKVSNSPNEFKLSDVLPQNLETNINAGGNNINNIAGHPAFNGGFAGGTPHTAYIDSGNRPNSPNRPSTPGPKPDNNKYNAQVANPNYLPPGGAGGGGGRPNPVPPKPINVGGNHLNVGAAPPANIDIAGHPAFNGGFHGGVAHTAYLGGGGGSPPAGKQQYQQKIQFNQKPQRISQPQRVSHQPVRVQGGGMNYGTPVVGYPASGVKVHYGGVRPGEFR